MSPNLQSTIRLFLRIFSFFGLVQVRYGPGDQLEIVKSSAIIIPILLIIYWVNAIAVFCFERTATDKISLVSNIIQLSLNSIMISVSMIVPIKFMKLARRTIKQIQDLNSDLEKAQIFLDFKSMRRNFLLIFGFFFIFLVYSVTYDAYVTFKNGMMSIKYWFVTILPSVYMVLLLTQSILALAFTLSIYNRVNKTMARQLPAEDEVEEDASYVSSAKQIFPNKDPEHFPSNIGAPFFGRILQILSSLNEICEKLESYFGPLFLSTFTTIFVVTSIQMYYCYQILIQAEDESRGYSLWSLFMCLNVIIVNCVLVISITAICQAITNQVTFGVAR